MCGGVPKVPNDVMSNEKGCVMNEWNFARFVWQPSYLSFMVLAYEMDMFLRALTINAHSEIIKFRYVSIGNIHRFHCSSLKSQEQKIGPSTKLEFERVVGLSEPHGP